jgi:hypothetical protein
MQKKEKKKRKRKKGCYDMLLHMPIVAKEWSYQTMKQWYMRLEEVYIGEYIYIYIGSKL